MKRSEDICDRIRAILDEVLGRTGELPPALSLRPDEFDAVCAAFCLGHGQEVASIAFPVRGKVVLLHRDVC